MYAKTLFTLGMAASVSAHMRLRDPVPFGENTSSDSGPVQLSGSDFPCGPSSKGGYILKSVNQYQAGQGYPLKFTGVATHGGGSCQVSLSKDTKPTANSVWKVIKSIEGGCPARNEVGNMGGDAQANNPDPYEYDFTIPSDIEAGNYTIAWSWVNKIGNREFYMSCGAAAISGSGSGAGFDSLPDMFIANVKSKTCLETKEGTDIKYPNPGSDVEQLNGATNVFAGPVATACPGGVAPEGAAPVQSPAKPTPAPGNAAPPAPSAPAAPSKSKTLPGAVFVTIQTGVADASPAPVNPEKPAAPAVTAPAEKPASPAPADPAPVAPAPAAPAPGSGGSAFAVGTACTTEGYWNCIGGSSFQRCASGAWSAVQALAAGTSCSGSVSENISLQRKNKRSKIRFGAKYVL